MKNMNLTLSGTIPFDDGDFIPNAEFLRRLDEAFSENIHLNKTQMNTALRSRWDYSMRKIEWLKRNGHIASEKDGRIEKFSLTPKGREMLVNFKRYLGSLTGQKSLAMLLMSSLFVLTVLIRSYMS